MKSTYTSQVLQRALDILECFTEQQNELTLAEIVGKTGLDRSTARRLIWNLAERGLLRSVSTGRYQLGLRALSMGSIVWNSFSLREAAAAPLAALGAQVSGTVLLGAWQGDYFVIVDRREYVSEGLAMVAMRSPVGATRPLTYGPIGRVLMATLPDAEVAELIAKYPLRAHTPYSITEVGVFLESLERIRERGYDMDVNEVVEGIMSFAAPVLDFSGQTVGVLCLGIPATRENDAPFLELVLARLMETSTAISKNMGYLHERAPSSDDNGGADSACFLP